jgi:phospholipid transport system transporter-binding protein
MSVAGFAIAAAGTGRLEASGELTFETAAQALRTGLEVLAGAASWVVDLSRITAGDSAGIAVLVEWLSAAQARGASLRYEGMPEQMHAIARISDLEDLLHEH